MKVEVSSYFPCTFEQCAAQLQTTRLLEYVSRPLLCFVPIDPPVLPAMWQVGNYCVGLRLFGLIPLAQQAIVISIPHAGADSAELRDNGYGSFIARWDHRILMRRDGAGVHYTDRVDIDAGVLTPLVWAFASVFYRHRQRRWKKLIASGFVYA